MGGGFKAISLIKQFNEMGIETVVVGTQTGKAEDYEMIEGLVKDGTVILDDANPRAGGVHAAKGRHILVGGVKERPLAYKLGIAFCDPTMSASMPWLALRVSAISQEVNLTINSPVWDYCR